MEKQNDKHAISLPERLPLPKARRRRSSVSLCSIVFVLVCATKRWLKLLSFSSFSFDDARSVVANLVHLIF
jgi:hypothetical protein